MTSILTSIFKWRDMEVRREERWRESGVVDPHDHRKMRIGHSKLRQSRAGP